MTDILHIAALSPVALLFLAYALSELFELFLAIGEQIRPKMNKSGQYWNNLGKI